MAVKQFAIPLDTSSAQTGDITFKELADAKSEATFQLTNVTSGQSNELDLVTSKNGSPTSHTFEATVSNGVATKILSASVLAAIYADGNGGDWDYVEAHWALGDVDKPDPSVCNITQGGHTFDLFGWPPKKH
jgi:hypothetical protein